MEMSAIDHVRRVQSREHGWNTFCPKCKEAIDDRPWPVFEDPKNILCRRCSDEHAPALSAVADLIPDTTVDERARFCVVTAGTQYRPNGRCPVTGSILGESRREIEVGVRGTWPIHLSIAGGEDAAPTLAGALHRYFGTKPAERPAPSPPSPTPEQIEAERDRQARERHDQRRRAARDLLKQSLKLSNERADALLEALDLLSAG